LGELIREQIAKCRARNKRNPLRGRVNLKRRNFGEKRNLKERREYEFCFRLAYLASNVRRRVETTGHWHGGEIDKVEGKQKI